MSVLLETDVGNLVVDLYTDECPIASTNFLKLCKAQYYNKHLFFNVQTNYVLQSGDPTGTGLAGDSVWGLIAKAKQAKDHVPLSFQPELKNHPKGGFAKRGLLVMGPDQKSQFFFTLRDTELTYLDDKYTVFGEVSEGLDVLDKLDMAFVDKEGR